MSSEMGLVGLNNAFGATGMPALPNSTFQPSKIGDIYDSFKTLSLEKLSHASVELEISMPNNPAQDRIDMIARHLKTKFAPLKEFNDWLNSNGQGNWYNQVATFLAKLPLRVVRNEINLLYTLIKTLLYVGVHPLRASVEAAELLVQLIDQLTKPEAWTKIGAGITGGGIGQSLVSGNPLSLIAIGVGGALMVSGLSVGALKAALNAPEDKRLQAALDNFFSQVKSVPEALLTGLTTGVISGAIQKVYAENMGIKQSIKQQLDEQGIFRIDEATMNKYHMSHSPEANVAIDAQGNVTVTWGNSLDPYIIKQLIDRNREFFFGTYPDTTTWYQKLVDKITTMNITPDSTTLEIHYLLGTGDPVAQVSGMREVSEVVEASVFGIHIDLASPQTFSHLGFAANILQEEESRKE